MSAILFVGNVEPLASTTRTVVPEAFWLRDHSTLVKVALGLRPELIVVAGWRRLIPPEVLAIPRLGTVGFHSAKLPEYPGRAPVPWALIRGDAETANTMLFLNEGVDSGDIIDSRTIPIGPATTAADLNGAMAETSAEMLRLHLPALLAGTAPRTPQDMSRRGPLTTKDGWAVLAYRQALAALSASPLPDDTIVGLP